MSRPRGGVHYPRSVGEFQAWFGTDADCLDYLEWVRWPLGFACPDCGRSRGWRLGDGRIMCAACGRRTSVTAGTIFDRTRTPLTVWFAACWSFATAKDGISALGLQKALEIGSVQTAWAMLHRLRSVLVRPGRDLLAGTVEVDETYIGGEEPGLRGGRARGKKSLVGIAVEVKEPQGIGRCRMAILPDASAAALHPFVTGHVQPGARVITDAWMGYHGLAGLGYVHERRSQRGGPRPRRRPGQAAARGAPRRLAGQAVAAEHSQGLGRGGASAELPGRVRVPLQPAALAEPGACLLPAAGTRRRPRSGALPRYRGRQATTEDPADPASKTRSSAEPGTAASRAAMEGHRPALLRLNGNPRRHLSCAFPLEGSAVDGCTSRSP